MADEIESNMGRLDLTRSDDGNESNRDDIDLPGEDDNLAERAQDTASSDDGTDDSCGASDGEGLVPTAQFLAVLETSRKRKRKLDSARTEIRNLKRKMTALEQRLSAREPQRLTKQTWPDELQKYFNSDRAMSYGKLVALSQVEGNQSPRYSHPNLRLRPPTSEESRKEMGVGIKRESSQGGADRGSGKRLGLKIEALVLQFALRFNNGIHAISRLDPFLAPATPECLPRDRSGKLTYLRRYHVGSRSCNLTLSALRPNELLAPLLVCRQWHMIGSNIFFTNKFIFSSLGELGRWCSGIGRKIALVSRIEIFLIGSQHLTYPVNGRGKFVSRRTQPMMHLPQCLRLRELRVYLRETAPHYVRRRHETRGVIRYAKQMTHAHPNYRGTRNLHCVQGLDYIYALRGLVSVEFFDYDQWLIGGKKNVPVRDTDFVEAIRTAVLREKLLEHYVRSRLINLAPLLPAYDPPENDIVWQCLEAIGVDRLDLRSSRDVADDEGSELSDAESESNSDTNAQSGSSSDPRLGSADEPITLESDTDSDSYSVDSRCDDTSFPERDESATRGQTPGSIDRADDTAGEGAFDTIDFTNDDDDSGSTGQTMGAGGRSDDARDSAESSLFVGGAMGETRYRTETERTRSPAPFEQNETTETTEREESGLFVSDNEVVDLTKDE